jgi:sorbitol-specific phosphotransferase system component IIC
MNTETLAIVTFACGLLLGLLRGWITGRTAGVCAADQARALEHRELED